MSIQSTILTVHSLTMKFAVTSSGVCGRLIACTVISRLTLIGTTVIFCSCGESCLRQRKIRRIGRGMRALTIICVDALCEGCR